MKIKILFVLEHIYYKKSSEQDFEVKLNANLSEYIGHEQII